MRGAAFYVSGLGLLALVYGCPGSGGDGQPAGAPQGGSQVVAPQTGPQVVAQQTGASLDVAMRPQETLFWCWAASGEMVMDFLGKDVNQCAQANLHFGRSDCCNTTVPSKCVNGGWPKFDANGFDSKRTSNEELSWDELKQQIDSGRPVAFSWHTGPKGGHMMTAIGYYTFLGENYVAVNNPLPVKGGDYVEITYDAYVSGQGYTHWDDFYDITKR